jgi:steroid 5-alpha reductase family enzyme
VDTPDLGAVTVNLAATAVAVVLLMAATLAVSLRRGRHDTIDTTWGLGFAVIAVVSFVLSSGAGSTALRILVTVLTVVWGVRLAVHLQLRNSGQGEDPRYEQILSKARGNPVAHMVRVVYLPQAVIMYLVSAPVQLAQYGGSGVHPLGYAGVAVWLAGFGFESIGDAQLRRFRADPRNRGRVLDTGLWRYTRHPNYFGDACVWWGLYLLACHSWIGAATVFAPLVMTYLLAKGTGKPLLEKGMARTRPGYAEYVARTSGFFPLPPKRKG